MEISNRVAPRHAFFEDYTQITFFCLLHELLKDQTEVILNISGKLIK